MMAFFGEMGVLEGIFVYVKESVEKFGLDAFIFEERRKVFGRNESTGVVKSN